MVGRQTPFLALIVPLILVGMVDGRRGIRQTWPVAVVGGPTFALGQFFTSNYFSIELTDIVAALAPSALDRPAPARLAAGAAARSAERTPARAARRARPWPAARCTPPRGSARSRRRDDTRDPPGGVLHAYAPYLIIIAVFAIAQIPAIKTRWPSRPTKSSSGPASTW